VAVHDSCNELPWNPVAAGGSYAQLAGVLAGFVLAGIVVLLSDTRRSIAHPRALALMVPAFFVLTVDAFLFTVVSGEQDCPRAWSETMLAGGLLGVGGLAVFAGIAWLLFSYDLADKRITRVVIAIAYCVALIIGVHVPESTFDYLRDLYGLDQTPPTWLTEFVWASLAVLFVAPFACMVYRGVASRNSLRSAVRAGYVTVIYGVIGAILSGYVAGRSLDAWKPAPTSVVAIVVIFSVMLPLVALVFLLTSLPTLKPEPAASPIAKPHSSEPLFEEISRT
jgi:hypothetical protein